MATCMCLIVIAVHPLTRTQKEELNAPYDIKNYKRDARQQAPKELLDISPLGKSPVITDGDVTLAESGAIIGSPIVAFVISCSTEIIIRIPYS